MRRPDFFRHSRGRVAGSLPWSGKERRAQRVSADRALDGLRGDHPLVRQTEALCCTARQWINVAAVLTGSVIARAEGGRWAAGLVLSAAGVLAILSSLLGMRVQARRDCVTELIIEGNEDLPVRVVQRTRHRLVSARNRRGLARYLEQLADEGVAYRSGRAQRVVPLYEPRVLAQVVNELRELSTALQTGHVSARGVASVDRLVRHATSPLYGGDVVALRQELGRVRALLRDRRD